MVLVRRINVSILGIKGLNPLGTLSALILEKIGQLDDGVAGTSHLSCWFLLCLSSLFLTNQTITMWQLSKDQNYFGN